MDRMGNIIAHELGHAANLLHVGSPEEQRTDQLNNDGMYDADVNTESSPKNLMKEGKNQSLEDNVLEPSQMKKATDTMQESEK